MLIQNKGRSLDFVSRLTRVRRLFGLDPEKQESQPGQWSLDPTRQITNEFSSRDT